MEEYLEKRGVGYKKMKHSATLASLHGSSEKFRSIHLGPNIQSEPVVPLVPAAPSSGVLSTVLTKIAEPASAACSLEGGDDCTVVDVQSHRGREASSTPQQREFK